MNKSFILSMVQRKPKQKRANALFSEGSFFAPFFYFYFRERAYRGPASLTPFPLVKVGSWPVSRRPRQITETLLRDLDA